MTRAGAFESLGDELLERVLLACVSRCAGSPLQACSWVSGPTVLSPFAAGAHKPSPPLICLRSERQGQPTQCGGGGGAGADRQVGPVWSGTATVPCVAKRWRRVWNTSTLLHPTLALDLHRLESQLCGPADEAALLRLLAQRCAAARRVFLHRDGQRLRMVAVLRLVSPQLQAVRDACRACSWLCSVPLLNEADLLAGACSLWPCPDGR